MTERGIMKKLGFLMCLFLFVGTSNANAFSFKGLIGNLKKGMEGVGAYLQSPEKTPCLEKKAEQYEAYTYEEIEDDCLANKVGKEESLPEQFDTKSVSKRSGGGTLTREQVQNARRVLEQNTTTLSKSAERVSSGQRINKGSKNLFVPSYKEGSAPNPDEKARLEQVQKARVLQIERLKAQVKKLKLESQKRMAQSEKSRAEVESRRVQVQNEATDIKKTLSSNKRSLSFGQQPCQYETYSIEEVEAASIGEVEGLDDCLPSNPESELQSSGSFITDIFNNMDEALNSLTGYGTEQKSQYESSGSIVTDIFNNVDKTLNSLTGYGTEQTASLKYDEESPKKVGTFKKENDINKNLSSNNGSLSFPGAIEGAFGFKFGDKLDVDPMRCKAFSRGYCIVEPTKPAKNWVNYSVLVDPLSKEIASIYAMRANDTNISKEILEKSNGELVRRIVDSPNYQLLYGCLTTEKIFKAIEYKYKTKFDKNGFVNKKRYSPTIHSVNKNIFSPDLSQETQEQGKQEAKNPTSTTQTCSSESNTFDAFFDCSKNSELNTHDKLTNEINQTVFHMSSNNNSNSAYLKNEKHKIGINCSLGPQGSDLAGKSITIISYTDITRKMNALHTLDNLKIIIRQKQAEEELELVGAGL